MNTFGQISRLLPQSFSDLSIISFDCCGFAVYRHFNPNVNPIFINYTTPLVIALFNDNNSFLTFCENYDENLEKMNWQPYFQWSNEKRTESIESQWKGRTEAGKGKARVFIWDSTTGSSSLAGQRGKTYPTDEEIARFNRLNGYTIFLIDKPDLDYNNGIHFVKSCPELIQHSSHIQDIPFPSRLGSFETGSDTSAVQRAQVKDFVEIIREKILPPGPSDLLENYVIISIDCLGSMIYHYFYPQTDPFFIEYNTPLIAHCFSDSIKFIEFCEKYDEYMLKVPEVTNSEGPGYWFPEGQGMKMIHSDSDTHLQEKWIGRAKAGQKKIKIFVWDDQHMYGLEDKPQDKAGLIDRFNRLSGYTIFLTSSQGKNSQDGDHFVQFYGDMSRDIEPPIEWSHLSAPNATRQIRGATPEFYRIIKEKIMKK